MRVQKNNKWKTVFCTRYSYFQYQLMLFDLSNTPASFQGYINKILARKLAIFIIINLDNILIDIKDLDQLYIDTV